MKTSATPETVVFRPTHSCFDDALAFFVEDVIWNPGPATGPATVAATWDPNDDDRSLDHLRLVHGVCRMKTGQRYVHAWVEDKHPGHEVPIVWQAATIDDKPVWYAVTYDSFYAALRVEARTRYTYEMAKEANKLSGHFGPWRPDYRKLIDEQEQQPATAIPMHQVQGIELVKVVERKIVW